MIVSVTARGFKLKEPLYEYVLERLQHALTRFEDHVEKVTIRLGDPERGSAGGEAFCTLDARLTGTGSIRVEDTDASLHVAIDRGAARLKQAVSRKVERAHDHGGNSRSRPESAVG